MDLDSHSDMLIGIGVHLQMTSINGLSLSLQAWISNRRSMLQVKEVREYQYQVIHLEVTVQSKGSNGRSLPNSLCINIPNKII